MGVAGLGAVRYCSRARVITELIFRGGCLRKYPRAIKGRAHKLEESTESFYLEVGSNGKYRGYR